MSSHVSSGNWRRPLGLASSANVEGILRVLALETSSLHGSAAAYDPSGVSNLLRLDQTQRTAQTLACGVEAVLQQVTWTAADVQLIAVTQGPGSFTGLRAGVTFAKALAYATGAEVIGVNTLHAIAAQSPELAGRTWAVLDAQRQQLFGAMFGRSSANSPSEAEPTRIYNRDEWLQRLQADDVVTGSGLEPLLAHIPANVVVAPQDTWQPSAITVAKVGLAQYQAVGPSDLWKLVPNYYRKSAAEEKLEQR